MNLPDVQPYVYGQPQQTADGTTVITVAKVRSRGGSVSATPVGVFVIHEGRPRWEPAVDANRIAWIGVLTGLIATTGVAIAMVRRPPWPDVSITAKR